MSSPATRAVSLMGGAALVAATMSAMSSSALAAASRAPQICDPGSRGLEVRVFQRRKVLTAWDAFTVPPSGSHSVTRTIEVQRTLSSRVSAGVTIRGGANGVLWHVEAEANINVEKAGSITERRSVSVTDSVGSSGRQQDYVAFLGYRFYRGTWAQQHCTSDGRRWITETTGTWRSFDPHRYSGIVKCPGRYGKGTFKRKACRVAGSV